MKKNILFIIPGLGAGGGEKSLLNLLTKQNINLLYAKPNFPLDKYSNIDSFKPILNILRLSFTSSILICFGIKSINEISDSNKLKNAFDEMIKDEKEIENQLNTTIPRIKEMAYKSVDYLNELMSK